MGQIQYAKVQITAPKESLFVEEEKPAKASVLIKLEPGISLSNSQVKAISNLVAGSVQELETDGVTIVDTKGNLLTASLNQEIETNNQITLNKLNIQKQFENNLKNHLNIMLTKVLGPDNFSLNVKAKMNFDQQEVQTKTYSPVVNDEGIIRSEEIREETYEGSNNDVEGVPGTTSNLPQYQGENGEKSGSNYEKTDTITNYEINEKIEKHVYSPGKVESISVAVIVNNSFSDDILEKIEDSINTLKETRSEKRLRSFEKKFEKYDLIILDELGYIYFDKEGSELLFSFLSLRAERKSTIITSNLSFDRWNEIFNDPALTAAMVDRLTHKSYVLNMNGNSFRMKETKEWLDDNN
jgi:flagellar basal-body M-ring protein/flagellar hook-basal body protein fliF